MNRKEKSLSIKQKKILWLTLTCIWVFFVWGHSLMPGEMSAGESGFIVNIVNTVLKFFGFSGEVSHLIVRKAAHFTEYFILGLLIAKTLRTVLTGWFLPYETFGISAGFLVALCDESIQNFTPGRAMAFTDVMIDLSGVVCGVCLFYIVYKLFSRRKKKKSAV